jgi:hypothetical protein
MDQAADRYTPVMAQWGIPDPRQASGYPDPDTAPMAQWAWEFLRRSDDYREQWSETIAPLLKEDGEFDEDLWARIKQSAFLEAARAGRTLTIKDPFEALARNFGLAWTWGSFDPRRTHGPMFEGRMVTVYDWRSDIWPPPPSDDALPRDPQLAARLAKITPTRPTLLNEYEYWVRINVALPLKPQFEAAENIMQGYADAVPPDHRVGIGKPQMDKFARYLRILDFDTVGETDAVISECLFPSHYTPDQRRAAVRDTRNAARHWRNGYLRIAMAE